MSYVKSLVVKLGETPLRERSLPGFVFALLFLEFRVEQHSIATAFLFAKQRFYIVMVIMFCSLVHHLQLQDASKREGE